MRDAIVGCAMRFVAAFMVAAAAPVVEDHLAAALYLCLLAALLQTVAHLGKPTR